eukprot:8946262-Prorocentrum_lima.AAC.1
MASTALRASPRKVARKRATAWSRLAGSSPTMKAFATRLYVSSAIASPMAIPCRHLRVRRER